jgi:hypothetical protein
MNSACKDLRTWFTGISFFGSEIARIVPLVSAFASQSCIGEQKTRDAVSATSKTGGLSI